MKSKKRSKFFYLFVSFAILVLDQVSKYFVSQKILIACNTGGAWELAGNFIPISVIVLVLVFILMVREEKNWNLTGFALIFGGGLSNLFDRLFMGCVRDFINFGWFPSFNLADSAITVGVLLLLYNAIYVGGRDARN